MWLLSAFADGILRIDRRGPGNIATQFPIVSTAPSAVDVVNRLGIDIELRAFVVRAGDHVTEIGRRATVILKVQPAATAIVVPHFAGPIHGGGPSGLPIHAVENEQDDARFSCGRGGL